jgi:site-specific DNA recombinase
MRAAIYTRISDDSTADGGGVERQEEDCRKRADKEGWEVVNVYTDNDIGASNLSRKPRPAYDRMIADVEAGKVDAILAYSNSRLTRRPRQLEDVIELHQRTGVKLRTVVSGDDDLSTADGRMVARIKASVDAAEAERTGERIKRQKAQRAAKGLPQGGRYRLFGYSRTWEVIPAEGDEVKRVFREFNKGASMTGLAKSMKVPTVSGKDRWSGGNIGQMLRNPAYAGIRTTSGVEVGQTAFPALVTRAVFEKAQRTLGDLPKQVTARQHLLSGILVCGKCNTAMVGSHAVNGYRCAASRGGCGNTKIKFEWAEGPVMMMIYPRMDMPTTEGNEAEVTEQIEEVDRRIREAESAYSSGVLPIDSLTRVVTELKAERKRLSESVVLSSDGNYMTLLHGFTSAEVSVQAEVVRRYLSAVVIKPRTTKGPGKFERDRYEFHWIDGTVTGLDPAPDSRYLSTELKTPSVAVSWESLLS